MATSNLDKYVRGRLPDLPESKDIYLQEEFRKLERQAATNYDKITFTDQSLTGLSAEINLERTVRASETESLAEQLQSISVTSARQSSFYQITAPLGAIAGDLWIDSDDGNKLYIYSGGAWVVADSSLLSQNAAAITTEQIARIAADGALATQVDTVSASASRLRVYRQGTAPSEPLTGDLWIDTDNFNTFKYWSGDDWVDSEDLRIAVNSASITTEQTARADADAALATQITTLSSSTDTAFSNVDARITTEETTRSTADTALSTQITNVSAVADAKVKTYFQTAAPTGTLVAGDMWFDSDDNNKAYRYSGTAWVVVDDARIAVNAANISTEVTARADADTALATQITTLSTTVASNSASISTEVTARADADTALSGQITSLTSTVNDNTTSVSTFQGSLNGVTGRYGVTIDNNGHVSGISLLSDASNGSPTSVFRVAADQFAIRNPGASTDSIYWDGGTSKLIVRGDIEATSVTANTVTQTGLSTNAVSTDKIVVNAVTVTATTQSSTVASIGALDTAEITIMSTSMNAGSSGGVIIIGDVYLKAGLQVDYSQGDTPNSYSVPITVRVKRGSTVLRTFSFTGERYLSIISYDSGAVGTQTFSVTVQNTGTSYQSLASYGERSLVVLGVKR